MDPSEEEEKTESQSTRFERGVNDSLFAHTQEDEEDEDEEEENSEEEK